MWSKGAHLYNRLWSALAGASILAGCATFKSPSAYDQLEKKEPTVCVNIKFYLIERGLNGALTSSDYPRENDGDLRRGIASVGIETKCTNPIANLKVQIQELNPLGPLSITWAVLSTATLGIIPFIHDNKIQIKVSTEEKILSESQSDMRSVLSIIYVVKMFRDDDVATEKFHVASRTAAEISFDVAKAIRGALQRIETPNSNYEKN